jgi:hypothetical protein
MVSGKNSPGGRSKSIGLRAFSDAPLTAQEEFPPMAGPLTVHGIPVVDVDSHYTEPADLWTSRAPEKFKNLVPHVEDNAAGQAHWVVGDGIDFGPLGFTVVRK